MIELRLVADSLTRNECCEEASVLVVVGGDKGMRRGR